MFMSQVRKSYIYVIENVVTGAVYVGKANDVQRRWQQHIAVARNGCPLPLYRAMIKYDLSMFKLHVVDEHEDEYHVLNVLEPEWISYLKDMGIKLYNLTAGGDGILGYRHSDETISKISMQHKGKSISAEQRMKISESLRGSTLSPEARAKISLSNAGKKKPPRSRAHRDAISASKKGVKYSDERRRHLSEAMQQSDKVGHPVDEETRKRISEKLRGKVQSEETRRKRSESLKKQTPEMKEKRARSIKEAWARRRALAVAHVDAALLEEACLIHTEDVA